MIYHHRIESGDLTRLLAAKEPISFDGVHKSVYENFGELRAKGKIIWLFVVGDWVGRFGYCDWNQIMEMVDRGAELGWHSRTHREPKSLELDSDIYQEVYNPYGIKYFALPFGRFTLEYLKAARECYPEQDSIFGTNVSGEGITLRKTIYE